MAQHEPASPDELKERHSVIREMIVQGMSQSEIVHACLADHADWNITDRRIRQMYRAEWQAMSEEALGVDRRAYYLLTVKQLDKQIGQALKDNDGKAFKGLIDTRIKLMVLDNPMAQDWQKYVSENGYSPAEVVSALVTEFERTNEQE